MADLMECEARMFGTGELARRLGVSRSHLLYLIDAGVLPESRCRVGGKRVFDPGEVRKAEEAFRRRTRKTACVVEIIEACALGGE